MTRLARCAALLALAAALGLAESMWLPAVPIPGLRLGLANLAVVIALVVLGPSEAILVSVGRVFVVGVATGTLLGPASVLSLAGAVASWMVMVALRSRGATFSVVGWSVGGSAANVIAQLGAAAFLVATPGVFLLAPVALGLSLLSGIAIGLTARLLISRISQVSLGFAG